MARGRKTGGRVKGTPNKTKLQLAELRLAAEGMSPVDFLLSVMRDTSHRLPLRMTAARDAAPYLHPRLASVEIGNKDGEPLRVVEVVRFAIAQSVGTQALPDGTVGGSGDGMPESGRLLASPERQG